MSLTGGVTVGIPFVQNRFDGGASINKLCDAFKGRAEGGRPKVVEHKSSDSLTVKATGARVALNLNAMHRGAMQAPKVPVNAGVVPQPVLGNPQPGPLIQQGGPLAQPPIGGGVVVPVVVALPPQNPRQALTEVRSQIDGLRADMGRIVELHTEARTDGGFGISVASTEARLIGRQGDAQTKINVELGKIDKLIDANKAGPADLKADLEAARRALLTLAVEAEYPQTVAAARADLAAVLPKDGSQIGRATQKTLNALEGDIHKFLGAYPSDDKPDRRGVAPAGVLARIDVMISQLEGGTRNAGKDAAIEYLKDAKAAVELRLVLDTTIDSVGALRDRFKGDAELSKVSLGRLLKEFSHYGVMHRDAASVKPIDQLHALEVVDALAHSLANSAVPDVFVTEDPGVKKMLTALRVDQCQDLAVTKLVSGGADAAVTAAVDALSIVLGRAPTKAEIGSALKADFDLAIIAETARLQRAPTKPESDAVAVATGKAGFDKAMTGGELAAKTREAYFDQRNRLERVLGSEGITAYKPAVWLKVGIPNAQGGNDDVQRASATLRKLGKENPEAAFMVAGLAFLEHQVAKSDIEVLGLKHYDGLSLANFDPDRVLAFAGVTEKQMLKLGYTAAEAADFPKSMHNLSKAGFKNVDELTSHIGYLHRASQETFSNISIQDMVGDAAAGSAGAVGKRMLTSMLSDAASVHTGVPSKPGGDPNLKTADKDLKPVFSADVVEGYKTISAAAKTAIGNDAAVTLRMEGNARISEAVDKQIVGLMVKRVDIERRVVAARTALETAKTTGPTKGIDVDAEKPAGLRSAKAILVVLDKQTELRALRDGGGSKADIAKTIAERDAALDSLRGFDKDTMRRPWHAKIANVFSAAERPQISDLTKLRDVAANIVFLREGAKTERDAIDLEIGAAANVRQTILDDRRSLSREAVGTVDQMVRSAILAHWPADNVERSVKDGKVVAAYQPALKRAEVEQTLTAWGVDIKMFAPEISAGLNATLERHDLVTWAKEFKPIDRATNLIATPDTRSRLQRLGDYLKTEIKEAFTAQGAKNAGLYLINKRMMDEQVKQEIGAIHQAMKEGDKFDFRSGYKLSLNTGKIPIEPSATVGVRGKVAASALSNLVMERSSDGFKITARFGAQVQLGAELIVDQKVNDNVKIGASVGADVTGSYLGGYTETFPNTPEGRQACTDLIMSMAGGERPKAKIFESASDAATNREITGKLGVGAKGYAKAELTAQPFGDDGDAFSDRPDDPTYKSGAANKLGIGASAGLEVAASLGGKYNVVRSFNKVAISSEKEITGSITLNAAVYAKVITAPSAALARIMQGAQQSADQRFDSEASADKTKGHWDGGNATVDEQLLGADIGFMLARSKKYKQEYTVSNRIDGGERLTKAEIVQRSNLRVGPEFALIGIGSRDLAEKLETDEAFRKDYEALKSYMGNNDNLQITYTLTASNIERVADLMAAADDYASEGNTVTAAFLRYKATSILDNQESYEASKVTVLTKSTVRDAVNRGNAVLMRFDIVAELGSESAEVTLKVPPKKAA